MEVLEKPTMELSLPQRAAVALGSSELEQNLKTLAKKHADIVTVTDGTGRDQVHSAAMTLKSNRVTIQKTAKAAREDATAFQKAVIAEESRLVEIIEPEEKRLLELRDGYDAKVQAEREAKIAAERARIEGIKSAINDIRNIPLTMTGKSSIEISQCIFSLAGNRDYSSMEEFSEEANLVRLQVLEQLAQAETAARTVEIEADARRQDAARIAAEREELENLRKEQEAAAAEERKKLDAERAEIAKQRAAEEEKAAALRKIEEDKLAEQRAELARQQAAIDAARREQEAAAAAEQEKRDAEAKAAAEAEAKRLQDAADEAERQERAAAEARRKAENEQHMAAVHADIAAALIAHDFREIHAMALIDLIRASKVPHVTITY